MMQRSHFLRAALLALATICGAGAAAAQDKFPSKPVRIVVTFGAGGSGDLLARTLAGLGRPVTDDSGPGAATLAGLHSSREDQ